jgi:hypothetical protein
MLWDVATVNDDYRVSRLLVVGRRGHWSLVACSGFQFRVRRLVEVVYPLPPSPGSSGIIGLPGFSRQNLDV